MKESIVPIPKEVQNLLAEQKTLVKSIKVNWMIHTAYEGHPNIPYTAIVPNIEVVFFEETERFPGD